MVIFLFGILLYSEPTEFHIKLKLTRWLSDVVKNRKSVQEAFASLKFFEENIRNPDLMTTAQTERLDSFVRSALDCHLDVVSTNFARNRNAATNKWAEKLANHGKPAAKELCEMCVVRRKLTQYECIIFDKTLDERSDHNETIGTWHYSNEERLLRGIYPDMTWLLCTRTKRSIVTNHLFSSLRAASEKQQLGYTYTWYTCRTRRTASGPPRCV